MKLEDFKYSEKDGIKTFRENINLSNKNLTKIPKFFKNSIINGNFYCSNNHLKSLEGCPQTVNGNFYCSKNMLNIDSYTQKEYKDMKDRELLLEKLELLQK